MTTFIRWLISVGYAAAAVLLAVGLRRKVPRPTRRVLWGLLIVMCVLWSSYYLITALWTVPLDVRVAWSQGIQVMTLTYLGMVLYVTNDGGL